MEKILRNVLLKNSALKMDENLYTFLNTLNKLFLKLSLK